MKDIKEFYILGEPIETEIGSCEFLKVKEYPDYFFDLQTLSMGKDEIIHKFIEMNKSGDMDDLIDELKKSSLYEIVTHISNFKDSYYRLLLKVFETEESIKLINNNNFDYIRGLIMDMNFQKEDKINPNPEIQRAIERSRRVKAQEREQLKFADIISSVVGFNGLSYKDINEFTIYQLYMTYFRIAQIKNYDTSTLFATVSSEKIKIESWSKHIDPFEEEDHGLSKDQVKQKSKNLFGK